MRRAAIVLALVLAVVAHGTPRAHAAEPSDSTVIDAQMLVYEINEARWDPDGFRARSDASDIPDTVEQRPPLAIDASLMSSSSFKANELADFGYFAHQSAVTGIWPNKLTRQHGYPLLGSLGDNANNVESLHGGSPDPFRVLESFANSPSHRRHIFGEDWFGTHVQIGVGRSSNANYWAVHTARTDSTQVFVTGVVFDDLDRNGRMDRGEGLGGVTVSLGGTATVTNAGGGYALEITPGAHTVTAFGGEFEGLASGTVTVSDNNVGVDFTSGVGTARVKAPNASGGGSEAATSDVTCSGTCDTVSLVDSWGRWYRRAQATPGALVDAFYYGNPSDIPFTGDWNGDGTATPGLYRQSDGYVYVRNSNSQGVADRTFYFGNPSDVPLVGDFDGNGVDSVSLYRPSETRIYIMNDLGSNDGGLGAAQYSYVLGDFGDVPVVGDFDGDGVDSIGLYRPSTGTAHLRNSISSGPADLTVHVGVGWDSVIAGDWDGDGVETLATHSRETGRIRLLASNDSSPTTLREFDAGRYWLAVTSHQG